jgi:hypothetical protein
MKTEIPMYPDFPAFSNAINDYQSDIYIIPLYYIIITSEIISDFQ